MALLELLLAPTFLLLLTLWNPGVGLFVFVTFRADLWIRGLGFIGVNASRDFIVYLDIILALACAIAFTPHARLANRIPALGSLVTLIAVLSCIFIQAAYSAWRYGTFSEGGVKCLMLLARGCIPAVLAALLPIFRPHAGTGRFFNLKRPWLTLEPFLMSFVVYGISVTAVLLFKFGTRVSDVGVDNGIATYLGFSRAISVGALLLLLLVLRRETSWRTRFVVAPIALASLGCMLAVGARGPLLGLLVALVVTTTFRFHRTIFGELRTFLVICPLLLIGALFVFVHMDKFGTLTRLSDQFHGQSASTDVRRLLYHTAWSHANDVPVGFSNFRLPVLYNDDLVMLNYPHNIFLELGAELGMLSMGALVMLTAVFLAISLYKLWRSRGQDSMQTTIIAAIFILSIVNASVSGDLATNEMFFVSLGLTVTLLSRPSESNC